MGKDIQELLQKLSIDEIIKLKKALSDNPNLLDEEIIRIENEEKNKAIELENKKNKAEQTEKERILNLKKQALIEKDNAERIIGTPLKFLNEAFNYFNQIRNISNDEKVALTERIHAKLTMYAMEIMFCNCYKSLDFFISTDETYDEYEKNSDRVNYTLSFLKSQYEVLSYQYGKLIGLPDEKIINKTKPEFYFFGDVMHNAYTTGRNIGQIFDAFYDDNENNTNYRCFRKDDGTLNYPYINAALSNNRYDPFEELPDEYKNWRTNLQVDEDVLIALIKFLDQYYNSIGFTEEMSKEHSYFSPTYYIESPDDYLPDGRKIDVEFRTEEEKEQYCNLISLLDKKTK